MVDAPLTIARETWRALGQPRRAAAVGAMAAALLGAELLFDHQLAHMLPAAGMAVAFLLVAPAAYRILALQHPGDARHTIVYVTLCGLLVYVFGHVIPAVAHQPWTFLTNPASLLVCFALCTVGGWGLGRDVHLELALQRTQKRAAELEREAQQAQLLALRSHLDPHFLFNTLNAIAEWCRQDGEVAERAVLRLATMLRTILAGVRVCAWPLTRELELVEMLFELHLMRDPQLFQLRRDLPSPLPEVDVPPLVLLPLAENAVKHGPAAGHRGEVTLAVKVIGDVLHIALENPGAYRGPRPGSEGLPTVERRLELAYDGRARLRVRDTGQRTRAEVDLPMKRPAEGVAV